MILFKFKYEDSGNCRVYYKNTTTPAGLFCIQNDGSWGKDKYMFYVCSRDGEPSHEMRMPLDESFDKKVMPRSIEVTK